MGYPDCSACGLYGNGVGLRYRSSALGRYRKRSGDYRNSQMYMPAYAGPLFFDDYETRDRFQRDCYPIPLAELPEKIVREPAYLDNSPVTKRVGRLAKPAMKRVNRHLAGEEGAVLTYADLKIGQMEPKYVLTENGRIGKVLGQYNTKTKELRISSDLFDAPDWLLNYVLTHEIKHYVQDKFGVIDYYIDNSRNEAEARRRIEADAEEKTRRVIRKYPVDLSMN